MTSTAIQPVSTFSKPGVFFGTTTLSCNFGLVKVGFVFDERVRKTAHHVVRTQPWLTKLGLFFLLASCRRVFEKILRAF